MSDATIFECVRIYDPEVVKHNPDGTLIGKYSVERELSMLTLPPEATPWLFRCRVLSRRQRDRVEECERKKQQWSLCFRYGVLSIRNLPRLGGGLRDWTTQRSKDTDALDDVALDAIEACGVGQIDVWEIGSAIYGRSFLAGGVPLCCPQPDTSVERWAVVSTRLAALRTDVPMDTDTLSA